MKDIMYVTSSNGYPVNMREGPSTSSAIKARIPVGSQVNVIGQNDNGWTYVSYGAKKGYIMSSFLESKDQEPALNGVLWQCVQTVRDAIERAEKELAEAKVAVTAIGEMAKNE